MDIFSRKMDEAFENISGIVVIVDDILAFGKTREEHDRHLWAVLQRALDKGIRLNEEKLEVGLCEISYFGNVLSEHGLKPNPSKISAIKDMPPPENRSELETWFGMFFSRFAPNLAEVTSPLHVFLANQWNFTGVNLRKRHSPRFDKSSHRNRVNY